jgi:predicted ester cyclase
MGQANTDASRRVLEEAFGAGRVEVVDEVCAEGFVSHDPVLGDQDAAGVKQSIADYRAAFPDLSFTIDDIFAAGDKVVTRWTGGGTFENEFMGLEPNHEKGDPVHGINIDRYDDAGKMVETWGQWDVMTLMRDIGAIPEGATAAGS